MQCPKCTGEPKGYIHFLQAAITMSGDTCLACNLHPHFFKLPKGRISNQEAVQPEELQPVDALDQAAVALSKFDGERSTDERHREYVATQPTLEEFMKKLHCWNDNVDET